MFFWVQAPKKTVDEWTAWKAKGAAEGLAGTLVENKYTRSSDVYSAGIMLLQFQTEGRWHLDTVGQEFLNHLLGHEKSLQELLVHPWLDQARKMLPGELSMGLGSGTFLLFQS